MGSGGGGGGRGQVFSPSQQQPRLQQRLQHQPKAVRIPIQKSGPEVQKTEGPKQKVEPVSNHFSWVFTNTAENFYAGKTANLVNSWTKVTQDRWSLETISGYKVEVAKTPKQQIVPKPLRFNKFEREKNDMEIEKFLLKAL